MAVNKVEVNGETKLDLTQDTVTPENLLSGATAHNAAGEQISGAVDVLEDLSYVEPQSAVGVVDHPTDTFGIYQNGNLLRINFTATPYAADGGYKSKGVFNMPSPPHDTGTICRASVYLSEFGNATAKDVANGKTFTSIDGVRVVGTSGGGVSYKIGVASFGSDGNPSNAHDIIYYHTKEGVKSADTAGSGPDAMGADITTSSDIIVLKITSPVVGFIVMAEKNNGDTDPIANISADNDPEGAGICLAETGVMALDLSRIELMASKENAILRTILIMHTT